MNLLQIFMSHPVWDEWIEIRFMKLVDDVIESHPVWDEWIEIINLNDLNVEDAVSSRLG